MLLKGRETGQLRSHRIQEEALDLESQSGGFWLLTPAAKNDLGQLLEHLIVGLHNGTLCPLRS